MGMTSDPGQVVGWDGVAPPRPGIPRSRRFCDADVLAVLVPEIMVGSAIRQPPYGVCGEHLDHMRSMKDTLGIHRYWWREIPLHMGYSHLIGPWQAGRVWTLCCGRLIEELESGDSYTMTPALAVCNGEG